MEHSRGIELATFDYTMRPYAGNAVGIVFEGLGYMQPNYWSGRSIFLILAPICVMAGLLTGCSQSSTPAPAPKPFPDATIRVASPVDPVARALLNRQGRLWEERSGGHVELVNEDAPCDVHIFRPQDTGKIVGRLASIDLTPGLGKDVYEYSRILPLEIEHNMVWAGNFVSVPLLGESLFCVYRADLLESPRHKAALTARFQTKFKRPLAATGPVTWQQLAEIANYFANEQNWNDGENASIPRASLPPLSSSADGFDLEFNAVAASFARRAINQEKAATLKDREKIARFFNYQFDGERGAAAIANPGFESAMTFLEQLQTFRPKGLAERPIDVFKAGKAVAALASLADLASLQDAASPVRDKFGVWRVPGSDVAFDSATGKVASVADANGNLVPYYGHGGWMAGIDTSSSNNQSARDLILFLSSPEVSQEVVCGTQWAGGPTRLSHLENRTFWFNYGLSPERTNQLVNALEGYYHPTTLNPAYRLSIAAERQYMQVFAEKIRPAIEEGKPAAAALQETAKAWDSLAPNRAARLTEYRQSLGLR